MLLLKLFRFVIIRHLHLVSLSLVILALLLQYINVISQAYPRIFILTFSYNEKGDSSWNVLPSSNQFWDRCFHNWSSSQERMKITLRSLRQQKAEKVPKMDSSKGKQVSVRDISQTGTILTAHSTEGSQAQLFLWGFHFQALCFVSNIHTSSLFTKKVCVFARATGWLDTIITLEETWGL